MVLLPKINKTCGLFNLVANCVVYLVWINERQPESISKFFGSVGDQTLLKLLNPSKRRRHYFCRRNASSAYKSKKKKAPSVWRTFNCVDN